MHVRCYGARGSIAVSGPEYLVHGGNTTCLEIVSRAGATVVVDAGTGARELGNRLLAEGRLDLAMLFTHAHWDHILGFPFFKPIYDARSGIAVYGCPLEQGDMASLLAGTMAPPYFPVPFSRMRARLTHRAALCETHLELGGLRVRTIPLSHTSPGVGYRFEEDGTSFVFLTDNELAVRHPGAREFAAYVAFCRGADLLVHDAEYDDADYEAARGWGHSRWRDAVGLAVAAGVRRLGLFHHNQDRSDAQVAAMVEKSRQVAAELVAASRGGAGGAGGRPPEIFAVTQGGELPVGD